MAARVALAAVQRLHAGRLALTLPDGTTRTVEAPGHGPAGDLTIRSWAFFGRVLSSGDIGFAEAYMAGECETSDLVTLIELLAANEAALGRMTKPGRAKGLLLRLAHLRRPNDRHGARRNIAAHYDLGNEFYRLWLDPTMTYSSALFGGDRSRSLEHAQEAKYNRILDRLGARSGDSLLEIGCGWGGFAETAARRGVRVHALTISPSQLEFARARLVNRGLDHLATVEFRDYRDVKGRFDHIVSIEMIEAVGERYWPHYFETLRKNLNHGGKAILQAIVIADDFYERYRRSADFIQTYIFPGGMLPTMKVMVEQARRAGLDLAGLHEFGRDYMHTLQDWLRRFDTAMPAVRAMGFDERFCRMWRYYLAYCAAGFATGRTSVLQAEFQPI